MTEDADALLSDARLLLADFVGSSWKEMQVAAGPMMLRMSRLKAADRAAQPRSTTAAASLVDLFAPHLGTLRQLAPAGTRVLTGEVYASLELLGEEAPLLAEFDFEVATGLLPPGSLAEFNAPLLQVRHLPQPS